MFAANIASLASDLGKEVAQPIVDAITNQPTGGWEIAGVIIAGAAALVGIGTSIVAIWIANSANKVATSANDVAIAQSKLMKEQSELLEEQSKLLRDQGDAATFEFIINMLQDEVVRDSRDQVYKHENHVRSNPDLRGIWKDEKAPRRVAMTFDIAATVSEKSKWCREKLVNGWAMQISKCWYAVEDYLKAARKREGADDLFRDFETLKNEAWDHLKLQLRKPNLKPEDLQYGNRDSNA